MENFGVVPDSPLDCNGNRQNHRYYNIPWDLMVSDLPYQPYVHNPAAFEQIVHTNDQFCIWNSTTRALFMDCVASGTE